MRVSLFLVGRVWHWRFQVAGRRIQRSTKETVRARAEQIAWRARCAEGPVPTLAELAEKWLAAHAATASMAHLRAVGTFSRLHLYDLGPMRIDRIRTEEVEDARARHLATHAPATANHWLRVLKLVFRWALDRELLERMPWRVKMLRVQKKPRVTLPVTKAAAWLAGVDRAAGARAGVGTVVRMMLGLGLREREALGARWEWVDWQRRTYTPGETKGREAVALPMPAWLVEHLWPARAAEGLIVSNTRDRAYAPGYTRAVMKKAGEACGAPALTPHRLRGTFATLLSEVGLPVQDVQTVLRHKDSRTTMAYLESDSSRAKKAQEELARRMRLSGEEVARYVRPGRAESRFAPIESRP